MPEPVIYGLELVEIEDDERIRRPRRRMTVLHLSEPLLQQAPVADAREGIGAGEAFELCALRLSRLEHQQAEQAEHPHGRQQSQAGGEPAVAREAEQRRGEKGGAREQEVCRGHAAI